jgi:hypothetical protein
MTQLVHHHRAENDSYQNENSARVTAAVRRGFGEPHKQEQEEEGEVNAEFDSEDPASWDGPVSHANVAVSDPLRYFIYI